MSWSSALLIGAIGITSIALTAATVKSINKNTEAINTRNKLMRETIKAIDEQNASIRRHNELMVNYLKNN